MSKFLEMARRHGFGVEDITEDLTGEKPVETTEPDTSVKDAADLAAAAEEGVDAKPEGDTTVATGEAEEQTPEVASTDADLKDEKPVEATTDTTDKTDDITDVDNSVASNDADAVEAAAVVSVENGEDVLAAALSDEAVEDAKRKLVEAAEVLDRFTKEKAKKAPVETPANEENSEDVIPQAADADTVDSATDKKHEGDNEDGKELKEENETDEVIPEASDAEMLEGKAAIDAAAKDHDEAVSAVEVFEKVEASVEAHYEVVKHCAGRRGIDRHHVLSIGIALEHTLADFGIDVSKVVPSMESFGLEEEKKKSTAKLAERLKEILSAVLKALANAYRFVIDKAEKLVHQAKNFHPILRKRIADAKKAVEAHKDDIVSITVPEDLRKKLYVGKDGVVDIKKLASNDVIDVLGSFAEINDGLKEFATDLNEGLRESLKGNPVQVIKVLRQVTNDAKSNFEQASASGKQNVPDGFEVPEGFKVLSSTSEIPGGQVVINMAPAGENGEADYAKGVYGFQSARSGGDDFEGSVEAVNVSKAGIIDLLNGLSSVVDRTNQIANARVNVINVYKGMTKAIESYNPPSDAGDDVTPEQINEIKELYDQCLQITRVNTKYASANIDNAIKYVMSSLAPASLSLVSKALKKTKDGKGDEPSNEEWDLIEEDMSHDIDVIDETISQEGFMGKVGKRVSDTLASIFKGYESIGNRASEVRKQLETRSDVPKNDKIKVKAAHYLQVDGKSGLDVINKGIKDISTVGVVIYNDYPETVAKGIKDYAELYVKNHGNVKTYLTKKAIRVAEIGVSVATKGRINSNIGTDEDEALVKKAIIDINKDIRDSLKSKMSGINNIKLLGGRVYGFHTDRNTDHPGIIKSSNKASRKADTSISMKAPSKKEIEVLLNNIEEAAKILVDSHKVVEKSQDMVQNSLDEVKAKTGEDASGFWSNRAIKSAMGSAENESWWIAVDYSMVITDYAHLSFSVLRSAVALAEVATKNLEAK